MIDYDSIWSSSKPMFPSFSNHFPIMFLSLVIVSHIFPCFSMFPMFSNIFPYFPMFSHVFPCFPMFNGQILGGPRGHDVKNSRWRMGWPAGPSQLVGNPQRPSAGGWMGFFMCKNPKNCGMMIALWLFNIAMV